jgi:hypothetical protein
MIVAPMNPHRRPPISKAFNDYYDTIVVSKVAYIV